MEYELELLIGLAFSVTAGLIGALYRSITKRLDRMEHQMFERMRTLGHEDRAIRSEINDIAKIIVQNSDDERRQMSKSLDLIAKVFSHRGAIMRDRLNGED